MMDIGSYEMPDEYWESEEPRLEDARGTEGAVVLSREAYDKVLENAYRYGFADGRDVARKVTSADSGYAQWSGMNC